ncbi:MAG TPA: hypothetical protein VF503_20610 [Sphingobium sp.]|uniref:hypothetical protein n=1 Tax=Sphingobium sp. TaxID=1912891 RepID=UPI002ED324F1
MQIATLAVALVGFLHLKGPDGAFLYDEGEPVGIDMFGPGSQEFAQIEELQTSRALKRMQDNDGQPSLASVSDRRVQEAQDLTALTSGFRHIEHGDLAGVALFNAVYSDPKLGWIKEQALKHVRDWGKFPAVSPTA